MGMDFRSTRLFRPAMSARASRSRDLLLRLVANTVSGQALFLALRWVLERQKSARFHSRDTYPETNPARTQQEFGVLK